MSENTSDNGNLEPLLVKLTAMVATIASDVATIRADVAEIKAIQHRHGSRLAALEARLDTTDDHSDCIRP